MQQGNDAVARKNRRAEPPAVEAFSPNAIASQGHADYLDFRAGLARTAPDHVSTGASRAVGTAGAGACRTAGNRGRR